MAKKRKKRRVSEELQALRKQRSQPERAKLLRNDHGSFPTTDTQRRRAANAGSSSPRKKSAFDKAVDKELKDRKILEQDRLRKTKLEQKRRQRMEDMSAVRKVVLGGAPGLGKNRKH